MLILYTGGFHGEFFIGNIVTNTDKFHYYYFKVRSEKLNAYRYEAIKLDDGPYPIIAADLTDDDITYYSNKYGKTILTRTHDHLTIRTLPVIRLYSEDVMYQRRATLLRSIKFLDKSFNHIDGVPNPPINHFNVWGMEYKHTTNALLYVDIKDWLHNKNLEKIEDFLEIEYTQTMKDAVTQYYERDNVLLDKYFPNWQNQSNKHLIDEMIRIDKEFQFLG